MKLEIVKILDRGNKETERLWLRATTDVNLMYYFVIKTKYQGSDKISNKHINSFWFDPQPIKAGDYIVLYTRNGNISHKVEDTGRTTYFFFWGSESPLWTQNEDCAVVFEVSTWVSSQLGS